MKIRLKQLIQSSSLPFSGNLFTMVKTLIIYNITKTNIHLKISSLFQIHFKLSTLNQSKNRYYWIKRRAVCKLLNQLIYNLAIYKQNLLQKIMNI